jgi:hypothetical protein
VANHSTAAVTCRALVMLACLVAIPLLAVSGGALPEKLESLVSSYLPAVGSPSSDGPGEPARFQPMHAAAVDPSAAIGHLTGRSGPPPAAFPGVAPRASHASPSRVVPAGYEVPATAPPPAHGVSPAMPAVQGSATGPHAQQTPWRPAPPATQQSTPPDPFTAMQTRLQQLGATYVLLESIGNRQEVYRCYCRVAIGGDPSYAYYFEAIDSAPLTAMGRVVRQVEQWRAQRP